MAYILNGSTIRSPHRITETNSTQVAQNRSLSGSYRRDYFGSNKRIWILEYENTKKVDYDTIKGIYDSHLSTGSAITWQSTEANYTFAQTSVHIDLKERGFRVKGTDYISDFTLVLTEV